MALAAISLSRLRSRRLASSSVRSFFDLGCRAGAGGGPLLFPLQGGAGLGQLLVALCDLPVGEQAGHEENGEEDREEESHLPRAAEAGEPGENGDLAGGGDAHRVLAGGAFEAPFHGLRQLQPVKALLTGKIMLLEARRLLGRELSHHIALGDLPLFDVGVIHGGTVAFVRSVTALSQNVPGFL